jgi:Mg/Co/Ni transporter MgtE
MTTGLIDLRRFSQRGQEVRAIGEMLGRRVKIIEDGGFATIEDFAVEQNSKGEWTLSEFFLRRPKQGLVGRGKTQFAAWREVSEAHQSAADQEAQQLLAAYGELRPADLATAVMDLPDERMLAVAGELDDEKLADLLEELPEEEQVEIISQIPSERAAEVLDLMEPDDAADLLSSLPSDKSEALLALIDDEEAEDIRTLMQYEALTAGGLMTNEPVICSAETTVAEAMAKIRNRQVPQVLAAQVFVTLPPFEATTGKYLGVVHFQKLLRYPPNERLGSLLDTELEPVSPSTPIDQIHRSLASYDLVSLPVVDEQNRVLGVVTVDDVLDHLLPGDWRSDEGEVIENG